MPGLILTSSWYKPSKPFALKLRYHDCCGPTEYALLGIFSRKRAFQLAAAEAAEWGAGLEEQARLSSYQDHSPFRPKRVNRLLIVKAKPNPKDRPYMLQLQHHGKSGNLLKTNLLFIGEDTAFEIARAGAPYWVTEGTKLKRKKRTKRKDARP